MASVSASLWRAVAACAASSSAVLGGRGALNDSAFGRKGGESTDARDRWRIFGGGEGSRAAARRRFDGDESCAGGGEASPCAAASRIASANRAEGFEGDREPRLLRFFDWPPLLLAADSFFFLDDPPLLLLRLRLRLETPAAASASCKCSRACLLSISSRSVVDMCVKGTALCDCGCGSGRGAAAAAAVVELPIREAGRGGSTLDRVRDERELTEGGPSARPDTEAAADGTMAALTPLTLGAALLVALLRREAGTGAAASSGASASSGTNGGCACAASAPVDLTVDELRDVASDGRVAGAAAAPVVVLAELLLRLIPSAIRSRAAMPASLLMFVRCTRVECTVNE